MFLHSSPRWGRNLPTQSDPASIASIVGTRPEAIKIGPVERAIKRHSGLSHQLVATGQQEALYRQAQKSFQSTPDAWLGVQIVGHDQSTHVRQLTEATSDWLEGNLPDLVLVLGDTNSALAGALAARKLGIPVGHIEAGLRSFNPDRPFPEERNRVAIARLATLHFAPCLTAARNLQREGITSGVHVTGNPGIDALMSCTLGRAIHIPFDILVTCHRRENFGQPLSRICEALRILANRGHRIVMPVHSNPAVSVPVNTILSGHSGIRLLEPLDYPDMIAAIRSTRIVISDSGGLQEECAALGTPLLLLREETERPEVVISGNCCLVGSDTDKIVTTATALFDEPERLARMAVPAFPYGSGNAARAIIDTITDFFAVSAPAPQSRNGSSL